MAGCLIPARLRHKKGRYKLNAEVPVWMKYTLSVEEAARYFRIGENKLRKIIGENQDADYILWNGSRPQIKRKMFEKIIDNINSV